MLGCQLHPGGGHLSVLVEGGAASNSAPQEDAAAVGELEGEEASESHAATENGAGGADAGREAFVLANLFKSLPSHLEEDAHFPEGTHESSQRARSATAQTCALCSLPEVPATQPLVTRLSGHPVTWWRCWSLRLTRRLPSPSD